MFHSLGHNSIFGLKYLKYARIIRFSNKLVRS